MSLSPCPGQTVSSLFLSTLVLLISSFLPAADPPASAGIAPYQLARGKFPPPDTARYIAGELIGFDHINRTGILRPDRTDAQRRGDWDLPHPFTLLPYGSISYHGAPAELRDIPIGTHFHGWFYHEEPVVKDPKALAPPPDPHAQELGVDSVYNRCLRLEDDFSYCLQKNRTWKVDAIALDAGTITVTGMESGKADAKPTIFLVGPDTRVWKGRGIGALSDLKVGQSLLMNLTVCTLKGPGRIRAIWLDKESQEVATAHQTEVHRQFIREHGLATWVEEVDNKEGIVTATVFAGFDPKLKEDFVVNESITAAVAEDNLRTWDQINDRKSGSILELQSVPAGPGNSGFRIKFKPIMLLEGFRPTRIIRLWSAKWKVDDLPREERMYN